MSNNIEITPTPAEVGLPPGFYLALAEEPTEKFRREAFSTVGHDYEEILELGIFMTSLLVWQENLEHNGRTSMMPDTNDIQALYDAGYGMSIATLYTYGGVGKMQEGLGFYPDRSEPDAEELMKRFEWIAQNALPNDPNAKITSLDDVLKWGAARDLIPSINVVHQTFNYDMLALRSLFGVERRHVVRHGTYHKAHKLGEQIIAEQGAPLTASEMDALYPNVFSSKTSRTIRYLFGTLTNFWVEHGYVPNSRGMKKEELLNLGVQWAIKNNGHIPSSPEMRDLSERQLFITDQPLKNHFKGAKPYRAAVAKSYADYQILSKQLQRAGISEEVVRISSRLYDPSPEFADWLKDNKEVMVKLSDGSANARWVLGIMENGFDLLDDDIFNLQVEDMVRALRALRIGADNHGDFIFSIIPRIETQEGLVMYREAKQASTSK